ncbi:radical SAM protein [Candidatus Saccharibacteria bacterium]|nr:radical SAM protein [Candidatus Saccharibacteria bacterium]MBQ9016992.1 radical SAM protein [Candidatus Saccharibacteria bacterium]
MQIRLSGPIERDSIVNGPGLRAVVWTQGCPNHCEGCQNPETWDFGGGVLVDLEEVKDELRKLEGQTGLTFCGGEPFVQPEACLELAKFAHQELGWDVWSFSGFTYEEILEYGRQKTADEKQQRKNQATLDFLNELDALIDGRFVLAERDLTLKFRGSRNQRILRLKNGQIQSIE